MQASGPLYKTPYGRSCINPVDGSGWVGSSSKLGLYRESRPVISDPPTAMVKAMSTERAGVLASLLDPFSRIANSAPTHGKL
jgi:hypothetical protein